MLQNPRKTLGFKINMVYKIPFGGGKPYLTRGLLHQCHLTGSVAATELGVKESLFYHSVTSLVQGIQNI